MKLARAFYTVISLLVCGCSAQSDRQSSTSDSDHSQSPANVTTKPDNKSETRLDQWIGVYSSPSEIGGFTGTVLVLQKSLYDDLDYRKTFYSDVRSDDDIDQDLRSGSCLIENERIYIPEAFGSYRDGKPHLLASIERYNMVMINGHVCLMRDDAYNAFKSKGTLYDYGILIKVSNDAGLLIDFEKVEHKSIKDLYADKTKDWNDPFINGPNER